MKSFSADQRVALLVVPILLFTMLSLPGQAGAEGTPTFERDGIEEGREENRDRESADSRIRELLLEAIEKRAYESFVEALKGTSYEAYALPEVFEALFSSYELRTRGGGYEADDYYFRSLYE